MKIDRMIDDDDDDGVPSVKKQTDVAARSIQEPRDWGRIIVIVLLNLNPIKVRWRLWKTIVVVVKEETKQTSNNKQGAPKMSVEDVGLSVEVYILQHNDWRLNYHEPIDCRRLYSWLESHF